MKKSYLGGLTQIIGVNLTWYIVENGVPVSALEKGTGIHRAKLARILNGTSEITISELEKICDFLNIKIEEVIKDDEQTSAS